MCGFRLRRLRRVLATALLCLPLFAGLTTEAAAQTDVSQRIVPPATLTVGEGDGSVDITLTGKPDYDLTDVQINSVSSGDAVGSITSTCASVQDLIINNSGNAHIITARIADTSHTYSALTLCDDSDDEPDETTTLGWTSGGGDPFNGNAANCTLNSVCTTLLTIQDNDPTVVSLDRVGSGAVTEGATVEFRVTLGRALVAGEIIDVPLSIGGTNVTTSDWSLAEKRGPGLNRGVTLSATNTATPKVRFSGAGARTATLELTTTTSDLSENTETFTIALGSGTVFDVNTLGTNVGGGADPSSTANSFSVTVNNVAKGTLELVGIPQDSNEGNSGSTNKSFSVRLTSGGTVSYTVCVNRNADKGTATADRGTDWDWGSGSRSNCLTGETLTSTGTPRRRSYTFRILGDTDYEEDETIIVRLLSNNSEKATLGKSTFTYTIKNDDAAPVVSIERVSSPVTEGTEAKFTVSASPSPASSLTVKYTVTDAPGADFVSTTNQGSGKTITLGTSGMATITVATQADSNDEPDGPVTVTVNSGTGYTVGNTNTATVTVNDDDAPSTPGITDGGTSTPPPTDDDDSDGSPEDREALESIYGTAGGTGWENDLNWGSDEPLGQWYGVTVEDGRVTELLLEGNNLSGTIHEDIGGLEKLKRLYLNDNRLTGTVPLEIGDLAELGELALWGNPGLETIPEGFEKMVDRAVLRTLYDVNGPVGSWFPEEGELFDYSGWEGVSADSDGRISGLDLSGGGLSKEITGAISELSALEVLDLSGNADLAGELPSGLMDTELLTLDICGTGIRVSDNEELREWLSGIEFTYPEDCGDSEPESEDNEPMEAESSGGGGCAVASGEFNEEAYHLVMVALAAVALGRRKNRKTEVSSAER